MRSIAPYSGLPVLRPSGQLTLFAVQNCSRQFCQPRPSLQNNKSQQYQNLIKVISQINLRFLTLDFQVFKNTLTVIQVKDWLKMS